MEEIVIELDQRSEKGKTVKKLRTIGLVPAVIHDHGKESIVVVGQFTDIKKVYSQAGKHHAVHLKVGKKDYTALIKSVSFDPKTNQLAHIVFSAVGVNETVTAEIPVHIRFTEGNESTPAERSGFIVLHQLDSVEVEAKPNLLPDVLTFDGEKLVVVGDQATVADLEIPKGVTLKTTTGVLATVFEPGALQAANDAVGGGNSSESSETTEEVTEASS